ncbi:UNKNOWN [Stylonychia lemnae]|uniref:Basal body-orientation factor 1 n=1 Tax=Stylonychia lemnae TaxID=5949 RepID=A0A078ACC0_STYLE|nr:UNKNOWN [Stylonychia lemnae]CDW87680.1 UNKNOWN [Stylonychia lemnae]|eukprot:CDW79859.1 UNKNOWN [Stylonychia lemnae]
MIGDKESQIKKLHDEVYGLNEKYKNQEKDRNDVIERLTRENEEKMKVLIDLETKIQTLEKKNEKENNEIVTKYQNQIKDMTKRGQEKIVENDTKINELREERNNMDDTYKKRIYFETQLQHWRNQCNSIQKVIQDEKYNIQIEQAKMKKAIESEYKESLEKFKAQAQLDAERNYYKREKQKMADDNKTFKRDMMLNLGTADQYDQRGKNQQKKIKVLKSKIQILEKSLAQIVEDFEKEKELVRFQHEQIIKEQKEEILNLREIMRSKNSEAKKVKALSQVILDQRSDVEQFFLEALEQIKEEIRKKIAIERKQRRLGQTMGTTLPGVEPENSNQQTQNQSKSYADKVDLNDLDWEDRERVLRLLFSKMNAGVPGNVSNSYNEQQDSAGFNKQANRQSAITGGSQLPAIQYEEEQ